MQFDDLMPTDRKEMLRSFALNIWKQKDGGYYLELNGFTHGPFRTKQEVFVEARREAEKQLRD
jgi:hypothetical protein